MTLVGRDAELAAAADAVAAGAGGALWIEGEAGIGKSALLAAGLAGAEEAGCRVLRAYADEVSVRLPLRVLLDVLPEPADESDPVPVLADRLLTQLDRLAAAGPVVLAVDDAQWLDEASLLVLLRLCRSVRQHPLLLVCTARPTARQSGPARLRRMVADSGGLIELGPLAEPQVLELAASLAGPDLPPAVRKALDRADGNPLFVRELVDAGARLDQGLPASLADAIADRLAALPEPALELLRTASLFGPAFAVTDLAVVADRNPMELAGPVQDAVDAGVLVESGVRLAFRHDLIRQALHEAIPAGLRAALHGQAARALAVAGAAPERVAGQLLAADDFDGAEEPELPDWAVDWLLGPAGARLNARAPELAAEVLARVPDRVDAARLEPLRALLAAVLLRLGRREDAAVVAEEVLRTAVDPARVAELDWTVGYALASVQQYGQAEAVVAHALARPGLPLNWSARLHALAARSRLASGRTEPGMAAARTALAEAERTDDRLAVGNARQVLGLGEYQQGDLAGSAEQFRAGLDALGDSAEEADLRLHLLQNIATSLAILDRPAEGERVAHELLVLAERTATPMRLANSRLSVADFYYHLGRWDDSLAELEAAGDQQELIPVQQQLWRLGLTAVILVQRGDADRAGELLRECLELSTEDGPLTAGGEYIQWGRALLAETTGRTEEAAGLLAELVEQADFVSLHRTFLPVATALSLATGDASTAERAAAIARADEGLAPDVPSLAACRAHCDGLLAGDGAQVLAAAEAYRDSGRPREAGRAFADAGDLLAAAGEAEAARRAHRQAAEVWTALGATAYLRRIERTLPRRRRADRPATGWGALTPAELDIAALVADGLANPDIAARQFLSRRTVEVHVSHILAKLGARSRVDIAREYASVR